MKIIGLIPIEKRSKCRCHFCGETRSVKYVTEIKIASLGNTPVQVCCCNKCILIEKETNVNGNELYGPAE